MRLCPHPCRRFPPPIKAYFLSTLASLIFFASLVLQAQDTLDVVPLYDSYIIHHIHIEGNKKTKRSIILRELIISPGQIIPALKLDTLLQICEKQIYNTQLFNEVKITPVFLADSLIDLHIRVYERWYVIAFPLFELVDPNFNVWWRDQHRDLRRTKYGGIATVQNVRGRNEDLEIGLRWGYTRQFQFAYRFPYINNRKTLGLSLHFFYVANHEVAYNLLGNKQLFFNHSTLARTKLESLIRFERRAQMKNFHKLQFGFYQQYIADTILHLNADYFGSGIKKQSYPSVQYTYIRENRDILRYPLLGTYTRIRACYDGWGLSESIQKAAMDIHFSLYKPLGHQFFGAANLHSGIVFPYPQSYYNRSVLGYAENYLRGYTYFLIPYKSFSLAKTELKYRLIDRTWTRKKYKREQFSRFPFKAFAKTYLEGGKLNGYAADAAINPYNNSWLGATGLGLDLILLHDSLITLEYTINRHRQAGFYVNFNITWDYD